MIKDIQMEMIIINNAKIIFNVKREVIHMSKLPLKYWYCKILLPVIITTNIASEHTSMYFRLKNYRLHINTMVVIAYQKGFSRTLINDQ